MINNRLDLQLNSLNENQLKAVLHLDQPLFVVAGAGTGKTNTLTTKIAYLIERVNVNPESILAVTFTNKAASEIRGRVNELIFPKQTGSWLYTFHAFALRILRSHSEDLNLGYKNDFSVIDEDDASKIIKDLIDKYHLNIELKPRAFKNVISKHKTKLEQLTNLEEIELYEKYQEELLYNNLMDFDDLMVNLHKLFHTNELLLKKYQNLFKYVLVDEFQDTDLLQYEIIKQLNVLNTFVVGDPDQSIYGFRGARYENNSKFVEEFKAETIVLDLNYRSTNNILTYANKLIKHNLDRTEEKDLISNLGAGQPVFLDRFQSDRDEVNFVINQINRLYQQGYGWDDMAILYRNNALSRIFEHELARLQIPYIIYGGISFYERREVKDILAYINVLINSDNNFYLKRIINVPTRKLGNVTISKLEDYAFNKNISMFEAISEIDSLNLATKSRLLEFKELILKMRDEISELTNLSQVVDIVFNLSNYEEVLKQEADEVASDRKNNIYELKNVFYDANYREASNNINKIKMVLDDLALMTSLDIKENRNAIKLATVHQVKGLEFKVVFVVNLEDGIFPNHRSDFEKSKLYEERRLLYVAITRAKERLYLTYAQTRFIFGQLRIQNRSMFIDEIISEEKTTNNNVFKTGDVIEHETFGRGIIINTNDNILQIAFSYEFGVKKISSSFAKMRKVDKDEEV